MDASSSKRDTSEEQTKVQDIVILNYYKQNIFIFVWIYITEIYLCLTNEENDQSELQLYWSKSYSYNIPRSYFYHMQISFISSEMSMNEGIVGKKVTKIKQTENIKTPKHSNAFAKLRILERPCQTREIISRYILLRSSFELLWLHVLPVMSLARLLLLLSVLDHIMSQYSVSFHERNDVELYGGWIESWLQCLIESQSRFPSSTKKQ